MLSVIVPSYNSINTLDACLQAIYHSDYPSFEVIVVDDGSSDLSLDIAKKYPCRIIETGTNTGLSNTRNIGVEHSQYGILVFIDADVVIKQDTLLKIYNFFNEHKDVAGVVGLLDEDCPYKNFFSQYKNLYMNFIFNSLDTQISFFYGSLHAIQKQDFQPYDESLPYAEDTDLGQRFSSQGKSIFLLKDLTVTHLKKHTLISILKNDFQIPFYWAHLFFRYSNPFDMLGKKKFAHAKGSQISSVLTVSIIFLFSFLSFFSHSMMLPIFCLLLVFFYLNKVFFCFLFEKRGFGFAMGSALFTLVDQMVMAFGIGAGTVNWFFSPKKDRRE